VEHRFCGYNALKILNLEHDLTIRRYRLIASCSRALATCVMVLALMACQRPAATQPAPGPSSAVNPDARVTTYACEDGRTVEAGYPDAQTAVVTVGGHAYTLKAAMAASGVRYVGFGLQWWTKGMRDGRLSRLKPGEDVASDPGVNCTAGGQGSPTSAQGAAHVVQD
jgi:membrane-bound inhibitor of C-type lysozyme